MLGLHPCGRGAGKIQLIRNGLTYEPLARCVCAHIQVTMSALKKKSFSEEVGGSIN